MLPIHITFLFGLVACGILVPQPGIEPFSSGSEEMQIPNNQGASREFPPSPF